jgi:hypothetical protein
MSGTLRDEVKALATAVGVRTPGAAPELVLFQLDDALREFTLGTAAWAEPVELRLMPGKRDYHLTAPCDGAFVAWILDARTDDNRMLSLRSPPYGRSDAYDGSGLVEPGPPAGFSSPTPAVFRVYPLPDAEYKVYLSVTLVAISHEAPVPPHFFQIYFDALMDGTLVRLFGTPGMPFASAQLAAYHGKRFRAGIAGARIALDKTLSRGVQPTRPYPTPAGRLVR